MQTNIDISMAFMETPDGVLSIHQISRKLKLPYGTAYNRIHLLHKQGFVQILPQGKAKLCALNPENPMTACLLGLGSAQATNRFYKSAPKAGVTLKSITKTIIDNFRSPIISAILLNPDTLRSITDMSLEDPESLGSKATENSDLTLDFFYTINEESFDPQITETLIEGLLPPGKAVKVTTMAIDQSTLLGMFTENENEAGLSAYGMLHGGIILFGFENFYSLILEAFARKLVK